MIQHTRLISIVMAGLFFATAQYAVAAEPSYSPQKVVYHFNQKNLKATAGGLRNMQNHINAVGAMNLEAVAVFHGGGVFTLFNKENKPADKKLVEMIHSRVLSLKQQGVKFNVCANTLKGKKIDYQKDLYDVNQDDIIPSGVAEISMLQAKGYTYIKP